LPSIARITFFALIAGALLAPTLPATAPQSPSGTNGLKELKWATRPVFVKTIRLQFLAANLKDEMLGYEQVTFDRFKSIVVPRS
jgi:hypothetical protein